MEADKDRGDQQNGRICYCFLSSAVILTFQLDLFDKEDYDV